MMRDVVVGAVAGLAASAVTAPLDKLLGNFVSEKQKQREKHVREDSPHHIAGEKFGERLLGRSLSNKERGVAQLTFTIAYGLLWGVTYRATRQAFPKSRRLAGLPFTVGFYLACDGMLAPVLKLSPSVHRVPWQLNIKEFINHAAWTATAEVANRNADRASA